METPGGVAVHGRSHQQFPHSTAADQGEDDQQHEKKSVLKKVKAKAKKIKETLTKHGHGRDEHEANYPESYGEDADDDDDDDDEEIDQDPEVHGAPMYETTGQRKFAVEDSISGQQGANIGNLQRSDAGQQKEGLKLVAGEADSGKFTELEKDPHAPRDPGESFSMGNYESKVTDPTRSGGAEEDVDPVIRDFKAMNVSGEMKYGPTGSHDQFSPEAPSNCENLESTASAPQEPPPETYAGKITSAATALAGTAVSTKDAVASKLGYGGGDNKTEGNESDEKSGTATAGEGYGERIKATLAPLYEKVADAGSSAATKIRGAATGGGEKEEVRVEETEGGVKRSSAGVPMSQYLSERLKPGEEDRALSQLISDTIHKRKDVPEEAQSATSVAVPESAGSGMGVVGMIRGAVTSLFGKGDSQASAKSAGGPAAEAEHVGEENQGGRRLQESGN